MNITHYLNALQDNMTIGYMIGLWVVLWTAAVLVWIDLSTWKIPVYNQAFTQMWARSNYRHRTLFVLEIATLSPIKLLFYSIAFVTHPRRELRLRRDLRGIPC